MISPDSCNATVRELPFTLAGYSCPLIDPPSQRGLFANKVHNITLAISRISPRLDPGQEFSFWHQALEPSAANGYRDGATFIRQRVTTSTGGGLCQLSGLIYNLALLSGCEILERFPHSIDAYGEDRYIPLGRDATVAHGHKDLCFRNVHDFPIALELYVNARRAWGAVRASRPLRKTITLETDLVDTTPSPSEVRVDARLAPGEEVIESSGFAGKSVLIFRIVTEWSGETHRELVSHDRYAATPTVIRRGATQPEAL
jgi:vancomycin resistance protein VanW